MNEGIGSEELSTTSALPASAEAPTPDAADMSAADVVTEDQVKMAVRKVKDPDLNLNIVDLGLLYGITIEGSRVNVDITLTSPGCPSGGEITARTEEVLRALPGVTDVSVTVVWSPFWSPERIEPRIRSYLGF